jgi:methylisocitrate lyase
MNHTPSAGRRLRAAVAEEQPLQVVGVIHAYAALQAERAGFRALYLSGAGVANASYGLPDLGMTSLDNVLIDVRRITAATHLPLLVDADTGWGGAFNIARTVREMIRAGAAGLHLEDQVSTKRCGHRPGKRLVDAAEMADRIRAAVDARTDPAFVIMARTDALAGEGLDAALARARAYRDAGADMIFAEAVTDIGLYREFGAATGLPVLANLTEFGRTPLHTIAELRAAGADLVLYPLSAFRAMSAAADRVYRHIREEGTQQAAVGEMQTRDQLYDLLRYHEYEQKLDALFSKEADDDHNQ